MPTKFLFAIIGAAIAVAAAGGALFARRSRRETPPVSATVPRIEEISAGSSATTQSRAS
ncbi:hypothetical protein QSJ18_07780 [Gordonia sp. ABSL1-1]|uniref:hypothetical protein n=1 Tax=Gordonia sp. ABSL1-1 TaxID=3053923 RepID=UPI0025726505|nr:hypothetical protein [Gordonia sp. ABSL1-1]MDL9936637.1 hypothetical protein [Gordonia sp. ABSL1-1]